MPEKGHGNFPSWLKPEYVNILVKCGFPDYNSLVKALLEAYGSVYVGDQIKQRGEEIPTNVFRDLVESDAMGLRVLDRKFNPNLIQI